MRTIAGLFFLSGLFALLITPFIEKAAFLLNILDRPSERKMHTRPIPRIGGAAIFLAFFLSFVPLVFFQNPVFQLILHEPRIIVMALGALLIFALGLVDDIRPLPARTKFLIQTGIALIPAIGGLRIEHIGIPGFRMVSLGWLAIPLTAFWILLVINAINLIDGLDGLAAGVSFFVCMPLLVLSATGDRLLATALLASLSGAVLGFLRYNFNPASIFMGDSGSYFLGYMLATLSILSFMKTQTAFTVIIPLVALGLPLMDTLWATMRRFMLGRTLFKPDLEHIHHRLIRMGYSHRRVVLFLYGVTFFLGLCALAMSYWHDARNAALLTLFGLVLIVSIHKLGYLDFIRRRDVVDWAIDVYDQVGISRDRRKFLATQITIAESEDMAAFWRNVIKAARMIEIDYIALQLEDETAAALTWSLVELPDPMAISRDRNRLYIRFPLEYGGRTLGEMILSKDMLTDSHIKTRTFQRIELLRRNISKTLYNLNLKKNDVKK